VAGFRFSRLRAFLSSWWGHGCEAAGSVGTSWFDAAKTISSRRSGSRLPRWSRSGLGGGGFSVVPSVITGPSSRRSKQRTWPTRRGAQPRSITTSGSP